jgi:hypothetical protein
MRAKVHYVIGIVVAFAAFFGAFLCVFIGMSQLLGRLFSMARDSMHPFLVEIGFQWGLPMVFCGGSAFLAYLAYNSVVPARCPKCGNHSYRELGSPIADRWRNYWVPITYRCRTCDHKEETGWSEN